jgi:hypothetical protein
MAFPLITLGLLLPSLVSAATLIMNDAGVMRREDKGKNQLGVGGEMTALEVENSASTIGPTQEQMLHNLAMMTNKQHSSRDLCRYSFLAGTPSTSDCINPAGSPMLEQRIQAVSMCEAAANASCPTDGSCIGSPFLLGSADFNKYPADCFMTTDTPPKWFFNPSGYVPAITTGGTPMCRIEQYINGTTDANECGNDKYQNVMVEDDCQGLAVCLAYCREAEFRVLNGTEQAQHPKGCHINPADGCIRFNTGEGTTGQIKGIPVCEVKPTGTGSPGYNFGTSR